MAPKSYTNQKFSSSSGNNLWNTHKTAQCHWEVQQLGEEVKAAFKALKAEQDWRFNPNIWAASFQWICWRLQWRVSRVCRKDITAVLVCELASILAVQRGIIRLEGATWKQDRRTCLRADSIGVRELPARLKIGCASRAFPWLRSKSLIGGCVFKKFTEEILDHNGVKFQLGLLQKGNSNVTEGYTSCALAQAGSCPAGQWDQRGAGQSFLYHREVDPVRLRVVSR